jgi:phospholipid N-methyltransferase
MNSVKSLWLSLSIVLIGQCAYANFEDAKLFIKSAFKNPREVGAVLPSSHGVGEELMHYVLQSQQKNPHKPLHILEVGAGTGPMSEVIISHLREGDHVDLVEISPEFCKILHDKFDTYHNVSIHCLSILTPIR